MRLSGPFSALAVLVFAPLAGSQQGPTLENGRWVREAAAALMQFWEWADANVTSSDPTDCHAPSVTLAREDVTLVDDIAHLPGLGAAMRDVGWLIADSSGGGTAAGGPYTLTIAIGQADAGQASGGTFTLVGGVLAARARTAPAAGPTAITVTV